MISESVFHFRSLSGSYASLSVALVDLSTSRGRLAECTNRLQLTALIRERRRGGMSRRGRCFLPEFRGAPAHRRRSARTGVSGRVPMDARIAQYG